MEMEGGQPLIDEGYATIISILTQMGEFMTKDAEFTMEGNPSLNRLADARVTVFWNMQHVVRSTVVGLVIAKRTVRQKAFWQDDLNISPTAEVQTTEGAIQYVSDGLEQFVKLGLIQVLFSVAESSFRNCLRALDPQACNGGADPFQSVYRCLFKKITIQEPGEALQIMEMWRDVRNVVHNNGVYFSKSAKDIDLPMLGKTYSFRHGQKIDFINWNLLTVMVAALRQVVRDVVWSPEIAGITGLVRDLSA